MRSKAGRAPSAWKSTGRLLSSSIVILLTMAVAGPAAAAGPTPKVAFVTSVAGTADLGSWADAGSATGAAAADAICQARASAAGLANPGDFVAWLSTSTDDAYCRVNGLTGKRASNCEQPTLPNNAGPWVRVDGLPFLPDIATATSAGVTFYPPLLDEFGDQPSSSQHFWHESAANGAMPSDFTTTCGDWTSATMGESTYIGIVTATTSSWAGIYSSTACGNTSGLLCLEAGGAGPSPTPHTYEARLAFVTSFEGTGDLSTWQPYAGSATGIAAGNAICQSVAGSAGLPFPSSYVAWLSDSSADASAQITVDGPWVRPDGVLVATGLADLTDGSLTAPINVDELGVYHPYSPNVMTGTLADGTAATDRCSDWTSTAVNALAGIPVESSSWWTDFPASLSCSALYRLYCLSNAQPFLFADGFDSGGVNRWSFVTP